MSLRVRLNRPTLQQQVQLFNNLSLLEILTKAMEDQVQLRTHLVASHKKVLNRGKIFRNNNLKDSKMMRLGSLCKKMAKSTHQQK
jgi:hypothetical protein